MATYEYNEMNIVLVLNKILNMYIRLSEKINQSSDIIKHNGDTQNNFHYTFSSNFKVGGPQVTTFLITNNDSLSNRDAMIKRMIDNCISINDIICNQLNCKNKITEMPFDISKLQKQQNYEMIVKIIYYNFKYLKIAVNVILNQKNNLNVLKIKNPKPISKDVKVDINDIDFDTIQIDEPTTTIEIKL